jgi:hypothetical protein
MGNGSQAIDAAQASKIKRLQELDAKAGQK